MTVNPILPDEEVERLLAEHDTLTAQRATIDARLSEIDRAIVDSGEAKLRAIREWDAALKELPAGPHPTVTTLTTHQGRAIDARSNIPATETGEAR